MSTPRQHHYLPKFYLQHFVERGSERIFVYERSRAVRVSTPGKEARIRDLYAFQKNNGLEFTYERILSQHEDGVAPILARLNEDCESKRFRPMSTEECAALAEFAGITFMRVPSGLRLNQQFARPASKAVLEEAAKSAEKFRALALDLSRDVPSIPNDPAVMEQIIEQARLHIVDGYLERPESPDTPLMSMIANGLMIAEELLSSSKCQLILAPKDESFLTGDLPIVTLAPEGTNTRLGTAFNDPATEVWLPVGRKVCLRWTRLNVDHFGKLPPRGVRMVNENIMRSAERYLYASKNDSRIARTFARTPRTVVPGVTAHVPMHEGRAILASK